MKISSAKEDTHHTRGKDKDTFKRVTMKFTTEMIYADIGFGLWAAGALAFRKTGEAMFKSGNRRLIAAGCLAMIPLSALTYEAAAKATGTDPKSPKCLRAWTVAVSTAAVLDGVAFGVFPAQIFALSSTALGFGAAATLWTTGVCGAYGVWRTFDAEWE